MFSNVLRQMSNYKKCVFKASRNMHFSLLRYFCNTKNVCSKQAVDCFLVYQLLISVLLLKCFYYNFQKTFHEICSLVYLVNYIKIMWRLVFSLCVTNHHKNIVIIHRIIKSFMILWPRGKRCS